MTREVTWTNSDGLVVGFGPNSPERLVAGVVDRNGGVKEARLFVDLAKSTLGAAGAKLTIPANSIVSNVYAIVKEAGAGGTSIAFGDAGDTSGWITAAQGAVANLTLDAKLQAAGAYVFTATEGELLPKVYATATDLYVTAVGTFTAGEVTFVVEYY